MPKWWGGLLPIFRARPRADPIVTAWAAALNTTAATHAAAGSSASSQQITISTADSNQVSIVICWQGQEGCPRFHRILCLRKPQSWPRFPLILPLPFAASRWSGCSWVWLFTLIGMVLMFQAMERWEGASADASSEVMPGRRIDRCFQRQARSAWPGTGSAARRLNSDAPWWGTMHRPRQGRAAAPRSSCCRRRSRMVQWRPDT